MAVSEFEHVVELASQLSPRDQLKLVAQIGEKLSDALGAAASGQPPGSVEAVLQAMREPPHLNHGDVDDLECLIDAGRLIVREHGVFDGGAEP